MKKLRNIDVTKDGRKKINCVRTKGRKEVTKHKKKEIWMQTNLLHEHSYYLIRQQEKSHTQK